MAWVKYKNWHCIYAHKTIKKEDICIFFGTNGVRNTDFLESNDNYNYLSRLLKLSEREENFVRIGDAVHSYRASEVHESYFQLYGVAMFYCVASFLQLKDVFHRGDIIAVFTDDEKYLFDPEEIERGFLEKINFRLHKPRLTEVVAKIFPQYIREDIRKRDEEKLKNNSILEQEQKEQETQRQAHRTAQEARETESRLKIQEDRARIIAELDAEKDRLEAETRAIEKRINLQRNSALEEKQLTAELLEMRERIARIDREETEGTIAQLMELLKTPGKSRGIK